MNRAWPVLSLVVGAAVAWWSARWSIRSPRVVRRANHRGQVVAVVLGRALSEGALLGTAAGLIGARADVTADRMTLNAMIAVVALFLVGAWDDRSTAPERGFRAHLGGLLRGRVTTGVVKLLAGVAAAVAVAVAAGGGVLRVVAASVLIASATNLWNALDVRPGRALKWAAMGLIPLLAWTWSAPYAFLAAAMLGAVLALLPFDLGEIGLLGDAGSNPLGFVVGVGAAVALSTPSLIVAAVLVLALQIVAETVTISRVIQAVPPLRWFDGVGRRA